MIKIQRLSSILFRIFSNNGISVDQFYDNLCMDLSLGSRCRNAHVGFCATVLRKIQMSLARPRIFSARALEEKQEHSRIYSIAVADLRHRADGEKPCLWKAGTLSTMKVACTRGIFCSAFIRIGWNVREYSMHFVYELADLSSRKTDKAKFRRSVLRQGPRYFIFSFISGLSISMQREIVDLLSKIVGLLCVQLSIEKLSLITKIVRISHHTSHTRTIGDIAVLLNIVKRFS